MEKLVALLRGINVGGHKKVPMKELKETLEKAGYKKVKTLLASGNVVFEANAGRADEFEEIVEKKFGFPVNTIVLPHDKIRKMVEADPFRGIHVTADIRLYVTFLDNPVNSDLEIPYESEDRSFRIIRYTDSVLYSVLDVGKIKTTDAMKILDREFGNHITTRNFNTVVKIAGM